MLHGVATVLRRFSNILVTKSLVGSRWFRFLWTVDYRKSLAVLSN